MFVSSRLCYQLSHHSRFVFLLLHQPLASSNLFIPYDKDEQILALCQIFDFELLIIYLFQNMFHYHRTHCIHSIIIIMLVFVVYDVDVWSKYRRRDMLHVIGTVCEEEELRSLPGGPIC